MTHIDHKVERPTKEIPEDLLSFDESGKIRELTEDQARRLIGYSLVVEATPEDYACTYQAVFLARREYYFWTYELTNGELTYVCDFDEVSKVKVVTVTTERWLATDLIK